MAEGGTPQRSCKDSISKASGDAEEAFCDPCCNMGKCVAVEGYCQTCQEYLCGTCLRVHENMRMTRGHTFLDKNQMPARKGPNTKQDLCAEVCKTHHPKKVTFYCKTHDEPGCGDCMILNHTSCKMDRIQDISGGFQATEEFKLIQHNLDKFHKTLQLMKYTLDTNLKDQEKTFDNIQHKITSFRIYINDYLDQIQKQITDEAAEMKKTYKTETNKLIAKNESMKSELKDILQKTQNDSNVNVNSIFAITKLAKQKLGKMENEIAKLEYSLQEQQHYCVFRPSIEIEQLVSANTPLGMLVRSPNVNTKASYRETINVESWTDEDDCWAPSYSINNCTLLGPDRMIVTDEGSKNIKLIDISNNEFISSYQASVPSSNERFGTYVPPWGITAVSTDQIAVTFPDVGVIQLLKVTYTFTKEHEIEIFTSCYAIAYKDGKFAVTCRDPDRVEIINIQGQILHAIQGQEDVLQCPSYITFGQDKDTVIVSYTNKVSVAAFNGQILHTYTHWEGIEDFVITPDGVLFVCSQGSKSVHAVSSDFKTSRTIINTEEYPKSISYCDINHRLYIIYRDSNAIKDIIKVYNLNV